MKEHAIKPMENAVNPQETKGKLQQNWREDARKQENQGKCRKIMETARKLMENYSQ